MFKPLYLCLNNHFVPKSTKHLVRISEQVKSISGVGEAGDSSLAVLDQIWSTWYLATPCALAPFHQTQLNIVQTQYRLSMVTCRGPVLVTCASVGNFGVNRR